MSLRSTRSVADPAAEAAVLLRRIGFAILALAAPLGAVGTRRGLVIVVPIGIALMLIATFVQSDAREPARSMTASIRTFSAALAGFLVFWAGLSLIWTPFPDEAAERLLNIVAIGLMAMLAVAALPERMRASNLYLLPIGVGAAALLAITAVLRNRFGSAGAFDPSIIDRGLLTVEVMTPAAVAWLLSRRRPLAGLALGGVVLVAAILGQPGLAVAALVIAGLVHAIATFEPRRGRQLCIVLLPGLVLAAPLIPFVVRPSTKLLLGADHPTFETVKIWSRLVTDDPLRLLTGHGLDTALRAQVAGLVPAGGPRGLLFEIWYELGLLGALALALLLYRAILSASRLERAVAPAGLSTLTVGFLLAAFGFGAAQSWWLISLAVAAVAVLAVNHGQFRTVRPKSTIASGGLSGTPARH